MSLLAGVLVVIMRISARRSALALVVVKEEEEERMNDTEKRSDGHGPGVAYLEDVAAASSGSGRK